MRNVPGVPDFKMTTTISAHALSPPPEARLPQGAGSNVPVYSQPSSSSLGNVPHGILEFKIIMTISAHGLSPPPMVSNAQYNIDPSGKCTILCPRFQHGHD